MERIIQPKYPEGDPAPDRRRGLSGDYVRLGLFIGTLGIKTAMEMARNDSDDDEDDDPPLTPREQEIADNLKRELDKYDSRKAQREHPERN